MIDNRIAALRGEMKKHGITYYVIPSSDAHQSEYVAPHWKGREWITGFDGSAGTAVIGLEGSWLWTDGRYHIQAVDQLKGTEVQLMKQGLEGVPSVAQWLGNQMKDGDVLGFDGAVVSAQLLANWEKAVFPTTIQLKTDLDLLQNVWTDRPELPRDKAMIHKVVFAGATVTEKLSMVRKAMEAKKAAHTIITTLDDLAWLFNVRGSDVQFNPVVLSYGIVSADKAVLYIEPSKIDGEAAQALTAEGVVLKTYTAVKDDIGQLGGSIAYDPATLGVALHGAIDASCTHIQTPNIVARIKARKSDAEMARWRECQVRDGAAMVHYLKWQEEAAASGDLTELKGGQMLRHFRSQQDHFVGESFNSIVGWKEHGAMMHYRATEASSYTVDGDGFFLFDSGGQYYDGTTDITRTVAFGQVTDQMKRDYTLTLVGHIRLNMAKFLYGATGSKLDMLARQPLWEVGVDYKCGTGHGVGYFLNVHEGPQGFRMEPNMVPLEIGHILTNEPGVYRAGAYGIRIENTLVVRKAEETEFGTFLNFEIISFCPIDTKAIDKSLMTDKEIQWLNDYHAQVFDKIAPLLDEDHVAWLKQATQAI